MLIHSHPTGNTFSRAAAHAFWTQGWLKEFHTCISWNGDNTIFNKFFPTLNHQFSRRSFSEIPEHLIYPYPWRESLRLFGLGQRFPWLGRHEHGPLSIDGIYRSLDRRVAKRLLHQADIQAVYAYEDGALHTFKAARAQGLVCFYDLPIGYWRAAHEIYLEESDLQPSWACTLTGLEDSPDKLLIKDEELSLSSAVIVPSEYVRSTLIQHDACSSPIHVVPFGSPPPLNNLHQAPNSSSPLRVLFVGSLGQRKGLSYALEAVELLGDSVKLTLIGRPTTANCSPLNAALVRHNWIETLSHQQILEQMRQHDVLLFPTLFDGFGLVITEALSQGLPVITTVNSGGPECIRHGLEGFIVPIRSSEAVAEHLLQLANNRDQLESMRLACLRRAAELSWSCYERELIASISQSFS